MKRIAIVLLCLSLSAAAEKSPFDADVSNSTMLNPSCPVTFTGIYADSPGRGGTLVSVHFVNQSEKRLIAAKLGLIGFDATRDRHEFPEQYAIAVNLKPQRKASPIFRVQEDEFAIDTAGGASVYLVKLMFSDGSTWQDDGTKSCSLAIHGKAKPKPNDE
jgi:hypothetical protein